MKKKVALIFSLFPCYDEVFILREAVELDRLLDLTVFSIKQSRRDPVRHRLAERLAEKTIYSPLFFSFRLIRANIVSLFSRPGRYIRCLGELFRLNRSDPVTLMKSLASLPQAVYFASVCRRKGIERVHGQWATHPATTARIISLLNGISFSFTGHAHDIHRETTGLEKKMKLADAVITCTRHNKKHLLDTAPEIDPDKIHVVYHGVDLSLYQPGERRPAAGRPFRLLSVGSLFECKGIEYLIEACRLLEDEGVDCECRVVGGGYLEKELRELAQGAGLEDRVHFTGYQPQEKMPEHYRWSDLFILPAVLRIHWGIPNVLLESLAVGVPVACTPLPSLPEVIEDPPCGFTIPEKDPRAIADLVKKTRQKTGLLVEYGLAGRKKIEEKWDIKKTAPAIAEILTR